MIIDQQGSGVSLKYYFPVFHHVGSVSYSKRLLDILEPTAQTVDALMKLELPVGVDVEIKAFGK